MIIRIHRLVLLKEFTEVERQSLVANVIAALSNVTVPAVKQVTQTSPSFFFII
jgi:hypothetical protein